jgi:hypothetical protein
VCVSMCVMWRKVTGKRKEGGKVWVSALDSSEEPCNGERNEQGGDMKGGEGVGPEKELYLLVEMTTLRVHLLCIFSRTYPSPSPLVRSRVAQLREKIYFFPRPLNLK